MKKFAWLLLLTMQTQTGCSSNNNTEHRGSCRLADSEGPTIFDKIIAKQIPATILFEDDDAVAFRDVNPQAPVHFLVVPKHRNGLTRLSKADESHKPLLGHLLYVAQLVAKQGMLLLRKYPAGTRINHANAYFLVSPGALVLTCEAACRGACWWYCLIFICSGRWCAYVLNPVVCDASLQLQPADSISLCALTCFVALPELHAS